MDLEQIVNKIEELKWELNGLKPLKPEYQQKLDWKFRLDWNYNSNHIEGNTLTYGETELLLKFGKLPEDTRSKDFREFEEMSAHDVAVKLIEELAKEKERTLTESFIRELNEVILVKNFWKDAITPDGQPARKEIKVGQYKTAPNSVQTTTGEIFHYASPEETSALMYDLLKWYSDEVTNNTHPLLIAALLHYKFVCIHPFDDGNGRISRLLMNYVLLKYDYPPAIIKSDDKKNYLASLNRADTGDTDAFIRYIGEQLIRSLELIIKAAKGESLEEPGDLDKEIELLKRELKNKDGIKVEKSPEAVVKVIDEVIIPFIGELNKSVSIFDDLFINKTRRIILNIPKIVTATQHNPANSRVVRVRFNTQVNKSTVIEKDSIDFGELIKNKTFPQHLWNKINASNNCYLVLELHWDRFKHNISILNAIDYEIKIHFENYTFHITMPDNNKIEKRYDQHITADEQHKFVETIKRFILKKTKELSN